MKHLLLLVLTYAALVAQTTLAGPMSYQGISPYLPLVALIAAFGLFEGRTLVAWSAIIGLGCDCLGTGALGREMFVLTLVALFVGWLLPRRTTHSPVATFFAGLLITATALFFSTTFEVVLNHRQTTVADLLRGIAGCAFYTALLAAVGRALWNTILCVGLSPFSALRPLKT